MLDVETQTVFVCAEGYAWSSVVLNLAAGGDRTVELVPGGAVEFVVHGEVPRTAKLRLYGDTGGQPVIDTRFKRGASVVIDSIEPGTYTARIEVGKFYRSTSPLAESPVEVTAGTTAKVVLTPSEVETVPKASASGVLVIPAGWDFDRPHVTFERTKPSPTGAENRHTIHKRDWNPVPGAAGTFSFSVPKMESGTYAFVLSPVAWKVLYELPPEGRDDLHFELAPPVDLTVYVTDGETGEPTDVPGVYCNPVRPKGAGGGGSIGAQRSEEPGTYEVQVPRGPIQVSIHAPGYAPARETVDTALQQTVALKLHRAARAKVIVKCGDQRIPWTWDRELELVALDGGKGYHNSSTFGGIDFSFGVSELGRYRLIVPEFNGFEPHPPVEFEMVKGKEVELLIELVRR